jgi:hypothetical protein
MYGLCNGIIIYNACMPDLWMLPMLYKLYIIRILYMTVTLYVHTYTIGIILIIELYYSEFEFEFKLN